MSRRTRPDPPIRSRTRAMRAVWSISSKQAVMSPSSTTEYSLVASMWISAMASCGRSSRTEPVGTRVESGLEDRFEDQLHAGLHDPIRERSGSPTSGTCRPSWGSSAASPGAARTRRALRSCLSRASNAASPVTIERGTSLHRHQQIVPLDSLAPDPNATVRNAGSTDKVEQVIEPSTIIVDSPLVQLGLDLQYPRPRASSRLGHGAPVFTSALLTFQQPHCEHAGFLRHAHGFPVLGLLRTLRPVATSSADGGPARRPAGCWPGRATPQRFPRSPCTG